MYVAVLEMRALVADALTALNSVASRGAKASPGAKEEHPYDS